MQAPYSNFEDKMNNAEVVEGIPVGATALINDSNKLKKIPLAVLDYNNLTNVDVMEQISENSMALVNDGGVIKQVSCGAGFGSGSGVKTAIIKKDGYDNALGGVAVTSQIPPTFTCSNMTFDEAVSVIMSGEPLNAIMLTFSGTQFTGVNALKTHYALNSSTPCIMFEFMADGNTESIYWTANGISFTDPNPVTK